MSKPDISNLIETIKSLKLDKPLVIFDIETTGTSLASDRIIELAYIRIMPNGRYSEAQLFFNPEMEIPEESRMFHGITDEHIAGQPIFKQKAKEIYGVFADSYYGGHNILHFDLPFLRREFVRAGIIFDYNDLDVFDAKAIFDYMEPRTLSTAYHWYCAGDRKGARGALHDTETVTAILLAQFNKYKEIRDRCFIHDINRMREPSIIDNERKFHWRGGEAYFNFSQYRDQALSEVARKDPEFLKKILKMNFSDANKSIIQKALNENIEGCA